MVSLLFPVIAETCNTIVGINDDGSGSSLNLELALQLAKLKVNIVNKIRFAWWGAEELGLLGSKAYVSNLNMTAPEVRQGKTLILY